MLWDIHSKETKKENKGKIPCNKKVKEKMIIKERLNSELKMAMKMKDKLAVEVIRLIKAKIQNAEKINGNELSDTEIESVLLKISKDHQNSIIAFKKGNRINLLEKEKLQLAFLQQYLPKEMGEEQIISEIEKIITDGNYTTIKDMGKVMKEFNENFQANGGIVSKLVKERLS